MNAREGEGPGPGGRPEATGAAWEVASQPVSEAARTGAGPQTSDRSARDPTFRGPVASPPYLPPTSPPRVSPAEPDSGFSLARFRRFQYGIPVLASGYDTAVTGAR